MPSNIFNTFDHFIQPDENAEELQTQLVDMLRKEQKRFFVVVDNLDKLASKEAQVIFRLIKFVGLLPSVRRISPCSATQ